MNRRFNFLITDEERQMLEEIAKAEHRTAGDWLRVTIREEHARRFGTAKKKSKK